MNATPRLMFFFLLFAWGWVDPVVARNEPLSVQGRVVDDSGEAITGAEISLLPFGNAHARYGLALDGEPEHLGRARTDASGRFRLEAPSPGPYVLSVSARGHAQVALRLTSLLAPRTLAPIELPRARTFTVTVVDPDGAPVEGARVAVDDRTRRNDWRRHHMRAPTWVRQQRARTDARGRARLRLAEHTSPKTRVSVIAPGWLPSRSELEGEDRATITLTTGLDRALEIVDGEGQPVAGAVLVADQTALGRSDERGRAHVLLADGDPLEVFAYTADAFGRVSVEPPEASAPDRATRLVVTPNPVLAGQVHDKESDKPIPGAMVWTSEDPGTFVFADAKGAYRLRPHPAETARQRHVSAAAPGFAHGFAPIPGDDGPVVLLAPTATLEGIVRDRAENPLRDIELRVLAQESRYRFRAQRQGTRTTTDRDGRFRMLDVPMDTPLRLEARAEGWAPAELEIDPLTSEAPRRSVEVTLAPGIDAFGYVLDADEQPIAGAEVSLTKTPPTSGGIERMYDRFLEQEPTRAASDAEGRFTFDGLGSGAFDLSVRAPGFAPARIPAIPIERGEGATDLGTVLLEPGVEITGSVFDPEDRPIAGARVHVYAIAGGFAPDPLGRDESGVETGASGSFTVGDLRAGQMLTVEAEHPDYTSMTLNGVRAPSDEPLRIVLTPATTLRGRLVDENDEGVAGQLQITRQQTGESVGMAPFSQSSHRSVSSADGQFEFRGLVAGTWDLVATAADYRDTEVLGLELEAGTEREDLRVPMLPGASVTGRVLDGRGEPLQGASVRQASRNTDLASRMWRNTKRTATDGEGQYRLGGLPTGALTIVADHPDHREAVRDLDVRAGENALDFQLERGLEISGEVIGPDGAPVSGAEVSLATESPGSFSFGYSSNGTNRSAADGSFTLSGLEDGRYRVTAQKRGLAMARSEVVTLAGASQGGVLVQMSQGGAIVGTVSGLSFDDMTQLHIFASDRRQASVIADVTFEGQFRMDNLAPGEWFVMASAPDGRHVNKQVTLAEGAEEVEIELRFEDGLTLSGQVLRDDQPVASINVSARGGNRASMGSAITDQNGNFRITGLKAGSHEVYLVTQSGVSHKETVELAGDDHVTLRLPESARVTGRAVDAATGAPVVGATVEVETLRSDEQNTSFRGFLRGAPPRTDATGTFTFGGLAVGNYRVRLRRDGYAVATVDVQTSEGTVHDTGEIRMEPAAALAIDVRLATGQPPTEAIVALLDGADQLVLRQQRTLSEQGRLEVEQAPAGNWTLLVSSPGQATIRQQVTVPTAPMTVVLPPVGQLEIEVPALRDSDRFAELRLRDAAGHPYLYLMRYGGVLDRTWLVNGVARVAALPAGVWQLEITTLDEGPSWTAQATVIAGSHQKVVVP